MTTATVAQELERVEAGAVDFTMPVSPSTPPRSSWGEPFGVLIVDDNEGDVMAIRQALRRAGLADAARVARDGSDALDALLGTSAEPDASCPLGVPDVILLDLELPKVSGFSVLRRIKEHPRVADVPVVVLTGTDDERIAQECMNLGANMYIVKPMSYMHVMNVIIAVQNHWLATENFRSFERLWSEQRAA